MIWTNGPVVQVSDGFTDDFVPDRMCVLVFVLGSEKSICAYIYIHIYICIYSYIDRMMYMCLHGVYIVLYCTVAQDPKEAGKPRMKVNETNHSH